MVAWPLFLLHQYVVALSQQLKVYVCIAEEMLKDTVLKHFATWGVVIENVDFLIAEQGFDTPWVRDWGLHPLFDEEHRFALLGAKYVLSTPFASREKGSTLYDRNGEALTLHYPDRKEDEAQPLIANQLGYPFHKLPAALTGGNLMSNGYDQLLSTELLVSENELLGVDRESFFQLVKEKTGMGDFVVISNFGDYGLQHIDCLLKLIDEETLLVCRPPKNHHLYERYEAIVHHELAQLKTRYNRPYTIKRIDVVPFNEDETQLTAYVNAIILNQCVYVPLHSVEEDQIALKQWAEAMPGYEIKGFLFDLEAEPDVISNPDHYRDTGWASEDVMHCRTRAIWDAEVLYISVKRLDEVVSSEQPLNIEATLVDYSGQGLVFDSLKLFYKINAGPFQATTLTPAEQKDVYHVTLKGEKGDRIDYYIQAESYLGKKETMPRVAPKGCYRTVLV